MTTDTDCIHKNNQEGLQVGDFKVGDRVVVVEERSSQHLKEGVVVRPKGSSPYIGVSIEGLGECIYLPGEIGHQSTSAVIDTPAPDVVAHPPHYRNGTPPGIEVIDIIRAHEAAGGTWETLNAVKYILRHTLKDNPVQDIKKAIQYLNMWVEQQEAA